MILYRPMVEGDVPAGVSLCRAAGWNQTADDWDLFLKLSPKGCCVAVDDDGQVRGTVATVRYEDRFSWIGMVLVDPKFQRQGIGIQLLRESLHILRQEDTVKLDATPAGRQIYLQLDFVDEYRLTRMECRRLNEAAMGSSRARLITERDLRAIMEYDQNVFGASREKVLKSVWKRDPKLAFVIDGTGGIEGYCFGRSGYYYTHIGPVVAKDPEMARDLTSAALKNTFGRALCVDVRENSNEWLQWLAALGFTVQRPLIRMYRGENSYPGVPGKQFAILGPEFG